MSGQCCSCFGQITLSWSPSLTPGVTAYNVCWGTGSGVYAFTNTYPSSQTNATLTGLVTNQVYFIAVQAVVQSGAVSGFCSEVRCTNGVAGSYANGVAGSNSNGAAGSNSNGVGGAVSGSTTAIPPVASTLFASNIMPTSATLNSLVYPQTAATTVSFAWGTNDSFGNTNLAATLPSGLVGYNVSNRLTGLSQGTEYFYAVVASNANGVAVGNISNFTTTIAPVVGTLFASNVTGASATLNGLVYPKNAATTVSFAWGTTVNLGSTNLAATLPSELGGYYVSNTLTGLNPGTQYFYAVVASNANGVVVGNIFGFITTTAPVVGTLFASNVTSTSATLNGLVYPKNAATTVSFAWGTTVSLGITNLAAALPSELGGYYISNNLTGLSPGTQYFYAVVASNANGAAVGNVFGFVTAAAPPGAADVHGGPPSPSSLGGSTKNATSLVSHNSGSNTNLAGTSTPATNVWGIPPFLNMTLSQGMPNLNLAATAGATFMIQGTTNLTSVTSWETITNITLTNASDETQSNQSSQTPNLLSLAYAPAYQQVPISFSNGGNFQFYRAVMPYDYMILASTVLTNQGYTPRLIVVNMPGFVDDVCYVNETSSFISCSNYIMQVTGSGSTIRQVATALANSLGLDWTSASQFTYSNGFGQILATVVETESASSDPIPGQKPAGAPVAINF